jgi:16S rRNA (uracil1498-N3)-methyltransferase
MHRFYLRPEQCLGPTLILAGGEANHALHVLRLRRGNQAIVLDGAGGQYLCSVASADRRAVQLTVLERKTIPPPTFRITLLQSIPKGRIMDSIVQKATELGVFYIVPILSERVVTQLDEKSSAGKAEKWQQVAIEAVKQCGAPWLPKVEVPMTPGQFIDRAEPFDLSLIGSLQSDASHPRACFQDFWSRNGRRPASVSVWIGPEGDFTPVEMNAIKQAGAKPITMGSLVLRVETAALYCMSILNYELQRADTD